MALLVLIGCAPVSSQPHQGKLQSHERIDLAAQRVASSRSEVLAALFDAATVDQEIYQRYDTIFVRWPADLGVSGHMTIRIQTLTGRIFLERQQLVTASAVANLGKAYLLPQGDYEIVLMPSLGEYYGGGVRVQRKMAIRVEAGES